MLVPAGQLIDMRPRISHPAVELVLEDIVLVAGQIDDSGSEMDDLVADLAIATAVSMGLFARQEERSFSFAYYWATPQQMQAYIEEAWSGFAVLPPQVVVRAGAMAPVDRPVRYRVREAVMIADYRKQPVR